MTHRILFALFVLLAAGPIATAQSYDSNRESLEISACVAQHLPRELSVASEKEASWSGNLSSILKSRLPRRLKGLADGIGVSPFGSLETRADVESAIREGERALQDIEDQLVEKFKLSVCGDRSKAGAAASTIFTEWADRVLRAAPCYASIYDKFAAAKLQPTMFGYLLAQSLSNKAMSNTLDRDLLKLAEKLTLDPG